MADVKISALPAVSSPAGSDEFAVNQGGTTKKMTLSQLIASGMAGSFSSLASAGDGEFGGDALAAAASLDLNSAAGYLRSLGFQTGGVDRWLLRAEATAESGSDVGSDLELVAVDDGGSEIGDALKITRADMAAVFSGTVRAPRLGIGVSPSTDAGIVVSPSSLAGTSQFGADLAPIFGSGATVAGIALRAALETAAASFTMASGAGVWIADATKGGGSTITTLYGLYVAAQTQGGTNWGLYVANNASYFGGEIQITGALNHDGTTFGLCGAAPSVPQTGYTTFTNLSTDRTCDADTVLVAELADIVGTLIVDLKAKGIISA